MGVFGLVQNWKLGGFIPTESLEIELFYFVLVEVTSN